MALHFYINGTAGAKDGTLLSGGDLSSCLTTDGLYPAAGMTISKEYTVSVRADEGETWQFCPIALVSDSCQGWVNSKLDENTSNLDRLCSCAGIVLGFFTISDTNRNFKVTLSANGSDTDTPNTDTKLMVWGNKLV